MIHETYPASAALKIEHEEMVSLVQLWEKRTHRAVLLTVPRTEAEAEATWRRAQGRPSESN